MGAIVSKAANGIGGILGNVLAAPFKSVFGGSCEDICSGPWDVICFIEHLCVSNLVKLLMILGLCFIIMMFLYLLFKLGICQCIIRSLCKICWAGCETYWFTSQYITCFLWHKLKNTKRVNRRRRRRPRFRDMEVGHRSSTESDYSDNYHQHQHHLSLSKKRDRERNRHRLHSNHAPHHHHMKLKSSEVSFHLKGSSRRLRNYQRLQSIKVRKPQKEIKVYKRRRIK